MTCECSGLIGRHCSQVAQVTLVAHQHDDYVVICMVPQLFQPSFNIFIGEVLCNIIDEQSAHSSSIVTVSRGDVKSAHIISQ